MRPRASWALPPFDRWLLRAFLEDAVAAVGQSWPVQAAPLLRSPLHWRMEQNPSQGEAAPAGQHCLAENLPHRDRQAPRDSKFQVGQSERWGSESKRDKRSKSKLNWRKNETN